VVWLAHFLELTLKTMQIEKELLIAKDASQKSAHLLKNKKNLINDVISNEGRDIKLKADLESEKIIKDYLKTHSKFPILAEESGQDNKLGSSYWVVDPLDGTSNYSRDFPICCISIALIYKNEIALGVINDFNRGSVYEGSIVTSAMKNSEIINVSNITEKNKATLATGLPAKGDFGRDAMLRLSDEFVAWKKVRMIGSAAMSCAYVASGQFDQYQENGIFLWDIAAGLAIIKSAGGNYSLKTYDDSFKVDVVANNNLL